ncbi:tetratricopeptide repeat protein [Granulicella sp. WH15]|uniref:tetratricopeptide repeat protein n=1 Tax=Granulicella sp. WH15 TaxID=2602070 RepID=UPI0013A5A91D|nr:tetratricopeptide repeat protein [Granulicella sp. WH15]
MKKRSKSTAPVKIEAPVPASGRLWRRGVAVLFGVGALLCLGWVVGHRHRERVPVVRAQSDYVDPAVCATCHSQIAATYKKTGMGRSFYQPTDKNVIEDYTGTHTLDHKLSGMHYAMVERDGRFFQRRSTAGFDGKEANVVEQQVDYVIGSGNHARTYLHRTQEGKLVELPVSWYTERSGYWAMSPGFDRASQTDMRGTITAECMFCHNGYPAMDSPTANDDVKEGVFPARLPEGIDCQRCHGPGRAHVAAVTSGKASIEEIRAAIVNPRKLPRDRQMEVCMECHLGTSALHTPPEIRNYSRDVFSFRPGQSLGDYKMYFEAPKDNKHEDFEIAHAAYRLRESACYLKSSMTCITCHNPHDIPRGEEAVRKYTAVCLSCHAAVKHTVALPASQNCLSCHMPKRRAAGSVHVVMTDHYIQRYRPAGDLLAPLAESTLPPDKNLVDLYYPAKGSDTAKDELYLAVARVDDGDGVQGLKQLQSVVDRQSPTMPEPYLELARAYARRGRNSDAVRWFDAALAHRPGDRQAMREIVPALYATGQDARALDVLQKGVALYPKDDLLLTDLGNAYLRKERLAEAQEALNRALAVNPERSEAHNLLGLVALRRGDAALAEQSFREAIRWEPDLAEAQNNLGSLLTSNHSFAEAEFHLDKALAVNPNYAEAHHGLGLLSILTNSIPRATTELRAAVRLEPGSAEMHSDLADLLAAQGHVPEAAEEYERVLQIKPDQGDAQLGLGLALLREHRAAEAKTHLEQAAVSSDENVSHAAAEALRQIER